MDPLMSQNTIRMTSFTDHFPLNFFYTGESVYFRSMDGLFYSGIVVTNPNFAHFRKFFSTKACLSMLICEFHIVCTSQPTKIG